jgi:hypothetical protein
MGDYRHRVWQIKGLKKITAFVYSRDVVVSQMSQMTIGDRQRRENPEDSKVKKEQ